MRHTISVLVENKFGVLARVAGLFSARGYNISSLTVSETHDPTISCMTLVVDAKDERILDQIKKQLNRLIDIISVSDLTKKEYFEKEFVFIKVAARASDKVKIKKLIQQHNAKVILMTPKYFIVENAATEEKNNSFILSLKPFGIMELVRTGRIAIVK